MQRDIPPGNFAAGSVDGFNPEISASAVSWPAVWAGAFVATAISLCLLVLGSAFGFASFSPWHSGPSPVTFTALSAIWIIIMQWVSSGFGGYITGRMRVKWTRVHTDTARHSEEVFFRDTANGFIAWAVSTVATAIIAATVLASVIGGGIHAGALMAPKMMPPEMAGGPGPGGPNAYFIDSLFRTDHPAPNAPAPEANAEATRILMTGIHNGDVPQADRTYLSEVIVARTGISPQDAQSRVDTVINDIKTAEDKAKQAAQTAHKVAATIALFTFLSFLVGAFIASVSAALGGRTRDL